MFSRWSLDKKDKSRVYLLCLSAVCYGGPLSFDCKNGLHLSLRLLDQEHFPTRKIAEWRSVGCWASEVCFGVGFDIKALRGL